MKTLDTLTDAQQHHIVVQFQQHRTLPEIQTHLWEDCNVHVTTRTIRNWVAARGTKRIFYGDEMSELKKRQAAEKRDIAESQAAARRGKLITMIDGGYLTGEQVADLVTITDPDKLDAIWDRISAKKNTLPESE